MQGSPQKIGPDDQEKGKGRLKIFLGYSAGVGKTYTMLSEARQRKASGEDVVIGIVETHGRKETERLMEGMENVQLRRIDYKGISLKEMDLEGIIRRRPQLVLVDELAHTNAPTSVHPKRYLDVMDIINNGIDVITTVNIQHIESLNPQIEQITGIAVKETIPDSILDESDEIRIIDLSPEDLIQRFREGKVYIPEKAERAMQNFFSRANLLALRQLTLRRTAQRINVDIKDYMTSHSFDGSDPAVPGILVCIGTHRTFSEKLIRVGRQLADEMHCEWHVIHVELTGAPTKDPRSIETLTKLFELSSKMGAKPSTIIGTTLAEGILHYANSNHLTKIILGKPPSRKWFSRFSPSLVEQIMGGGGGIDIYLINTKEEGMAQLKNDKPTFKFKGYIYSSLLLIATTSIGLLLTDILDPTNNAMLFIIDVIIAAVLWGIGPALFTSLVGVILFDFFLVQPAFSIGVRDSQYLITFLVMIAVGTTINVLITKAKMNAETAVARERITKVLLTIQEKLYSSYDEMTMWRELTSALVQFNPGFEFVILISRNGKIVPRYQMGNTELSKDELAIAQWCVDNGKVAGFETDNIPLCQLRFYPMAVKGRKVGVLGVRPTGSNPGIKFPSEFQILLQSSANQAALAYERIKQMNK